MEVQLHCELISPSRQYHSFIGEDERIVLFQRLMLITASYHYATISLYYSATTASSCLWAVNCTASLHLFWAVLHEKLCENMTFHRRGTGSPPQSAARHSHFVLALTSCLSSYCLQCAPSLSQLMWGKRIHPAVAGRERARHFTVNYQQPGCCSPVLCQFERWDSLHCLLGSAK